MSKRIRISFVLGAAFYALAVVGLFFAAVPAVSAKKGKQERQEAGYRYTPPGKKSEAYGKGPYGPEHLRRISKTEPLAAEPQVTKVIPLGIDGKLPPQK